MDKFIISDLQFHGHCGFTESEREAGQRLTVDLEFFYVLQGVRAKEIEQDLPEGALSAHPDYSHVVDVVLQIGRNERFRLLEALAERLAQVLLKQFPVDEVGLCLKKVHPPVEVIRGFFGVEIHRRLTDFQSR